MKRPLAYITAAWCGSDCENAKQAAQYDNNNFLYQSDSNDFTVLMNKVSEEQAKRIVAATEKNKALFLDNPYLKFKVNPQIALSIIYSLIMTIKNKSVLPCNHLETFDFMVPSGATPQSRKSLPHRSIVAM